MKIGMSYREERNTLELQDRKIFINKILHTYIDEPRRLWSMD